MTTDLCSVKFSEFNRLITKLNIVKKHCYNFSNVLKCVLRVLHLWYMQAFVTLRWLNKWSVDQKLSVTAQLLSLQCEWEKRHLMLWKEVNLYFWTENSRFKTQSDRWSSAESDMSEIQSTGKDRRQIAVIRKTWRDSAPNKKNLPNVELKWSTF